MGGREGVTDSTSSQRVQPQDSDAVSPYKDTGVLEAGCPWHTRVAGHLQT